MKNLKTATLVRIALMTAVLCVLGPLSIPIGPVPVSLGTFAVLLAVSILGMREGAVATLLYLLIGAIGIPVFSGFSGGFAKLAGPTGGYLVGYIPLALIGGWFIHRFRSAALQYAGCVIGMAVCYLLGTSWLAHQAGMTFQAALAAGVLPFIVVDLIKIAAAIAAGRAVRARIPEMLPGPATN